MKRIIALALAVEVGILALLAQAGGNSPYSAYGFGDMLPTAQPVQAMMAGTGLAITEPYSVPTGNPAGYPLLARPVFDVAATFRATQSRSDHASSSGKDARFMGFAMGVPFAGKWGLALGLAPYSFVDYNLASQAVQDGSPVTYRYTGSGGVNKAYFGLGRVLYAQTPDSLGNVGGRLSFGADFNFYFGSVNQTREALYSRDAGYSSVRAFDALVLRAPSGTASLIWQGDLTRRTHRDQENWRWSVAVSVAPPVDLAARHTRQVSTFISNAAIETPRDTIEGRFNVKGTVQFPLAVRFGAGVQNNRWAVTAEVRQQDWASTVLSVPGYSLSAPMGMASTYAVAARFRPGNEGNAFNRAVYRVGLRTERLGQEVKGTALEAQVASIGLSLPLNAVQTNSWLHIGGEFGQRGTTANGLLQERYGMLWLGVSFTPWRGERWFVPAKIL